MKLYKNLERSYGEYLLLLDYVLHHSEVGFFYVQKTILKISPKPLGTNVPTPALNVFVERRRLARFDLDSP